MPTEIIAKIFIYFALVKGSIIRSDFSIFNWIKFGKDYTNWYKTRETWSKYQKTEKLKGNENGF